MRPATSSISAAMSDAGRVYARKHATKKARSSRCPGGAPCLPRNSTSRSRSHKRSHASCRPDTTCPLERPHHASDARQSTCFRSPRAVEMWRTTLPPRAAIATGRAIDERLRSRPRRFADWLPPGSTGALGIRGGSLSEAYLTEAASPAESVLSGSGKLQCFNWSWRRTVRVELRKWGNGAVIRIPAAALQALTYEWRDTGRS